MPGAGYDYMENFEALTVSDRRVIEVTFGGTGPPAALPAALRSADACAAALAAGCPAAVNRPILSEVGQTKHRGSIYAWNTAVESALASCIAASSASAFPAAEARRPGGGGEGGGEGGEETIETISPL